MLATYFSFSDYSGQNLIRAFTGSSTISDYDISGVRINTTPKKFPYTYNFELYNSNVSVETYSITFVLSKTLANSNTKLASLCEFSKYQGSLVTYNVATTNPLTGAITGTAVSHSIGFLEAMSIAFLEDANHDLFECTLTIGSFDSLVNKTLETTAFPKSYGYWNLITPLFNGTISGRNS